MKDVSFIWDDVFGIMVDHLVDIGILDGVFVISDRVWCFEGRI